MANRRDKNDSTMDISASQLVPGNRPPAPKSPGVNKNDVSMWIGGVVGADDFAGAKKRASKSRAPLVIGLVALLAAAGGVGYYMFGRTSSTTTTASMTGSGSATGVGSAAPAAPPEVPAVAAVPVDAGADAPSGAAADAGVALAADAVSGADPKHNTASTKKKSTKKKKVVKKPTTTKHR